ncbi:unnamed protein product [Symbiodinium sp. CCMP2592]|nr:unnamed protein product [Symbiodinium sp. CCMP2592]CAE7236731.1 unnamed protein product [Symbiodinium sp. CCMP2592]CAE7395287.1 unnamed protein product [Symbiodinium sp. CCMP2592]
MPADVKCSAAAQVLDLSFRRSQTEENVLYECFSMVLASAHELLEYALYLRRAPACAAALIVPGDGNTSAKQSVLSEMKQEWETVLFMEANDRMNALLKSRCRFTDFQNFREIHTMMEQCQYRITDKARSLIEAWHPPFGWSANLESVFGEIQAALKKSNRSEGASMQAMMSVAVRSLDRRVCTSETSPTPLRLASDDYIGKQTAGLKAKIWLSLDVLDASTHLWAAQCLGAGDLLKVKGEFFVTTDSYDVFTPQAIRMKELPYEFRDGLPNPIPDETRMPKEASKAAVQIDPLGKGQASKALCIDVSEIFPFFEVMTLRCTVNVQQAKLMLYTLHIAPDALASKLGSGLLVRQGTIEYSLLPCLVETKKILRLPSASLSDLLLHQNVRMPKNTTVACKIRRLMAEDAVKQVCSETVIQEIIQILEYQWAELNDDPATTACRHLLAGMDEESEDEAKQDDADMDMPVAAHAIDERASRSLLSATAAIPKEITDRYELPENVHIHKTVFRDQTLPHYQGKLLGGRLFEGKQSTSASFNPDLPLMQIDERKATIRSMTASKRSEGQAFFMVLSWLRKAEASAKRRRVT